METKAGDYDCPKIYLNTLYLCACVLRERNLKLEKGKKYETIVLFGFQFGNHKENSVHIPQERKMH